MFKTSINIGGWSVLSVWPNFWSYWDDQQNEKLNLYVPYLEERCLVTMLMEDGECDWKLLEIFTAAMYIFMADFPADLQFDYRSDWSADFRTYVRSDWRADMVSTQPCPQPEQCHPANWNLKLVSSTRTAQWRSRTHLRSDWRADNRTDWRAEWLSG